MVRFQLAPQQPCPRTAGEVTVLILLAGGMVSRDEDAMKMLRRVIVALGLAGLIAAVLRARGTGGTPPRSGGWRELSGSDLE